MMIAHFFTLIIPFTHLCPSVRAQTLKNISHDAIPNYLDYFELDREAERGFALVQEYIDAPSLAKVIRSGRTFTEAEIVEIGEQILDILTYLHQRQPSIIHRDLKPSNILLGNRSGNSVGRVYLIDFGTVQNASTTEDGTRTIVGTYGYMPPEQFGGKTTAASDIYSLGATLIYLATGVHPANLPTKDGKIQFESSVNLNPAFINWLQKTIEPSCDRRFKTAKLAWQALQDRDRVRKQTSVNLLKQPARSNFQLNKSDEAIELVLYARPNFKIFFLIFFAIFWNGFIFVWTAFALSMTIGSINIVFALFSLPFWAIGIGMVGFILFSCIGIVSIKIDRELISRTYECLGFKYHHPKASPRMGIKAIERTKQYLDTIHNYRSTIVPPSVTIWANEEMYKINSSMFSNNYDYFGTKGNNVLILRELDWVAQELSDWLDIPVTYPKPPTVNDL